MPTTVAIRCSSCKKVFDGERWMKMCPDCYGRTIAWKSQHAGTHKFINTLDPIFIEHRARALSKHLPHLRENLVEEHLGLAIRSYNTIFSLGHSHGCPVYKGRACTCGKEKSLDDLSALILGTVKQSSHDRED